MRGPHAAVLKGRNKKRVATIFEVGGPLCKLAFGKVETRNKLSNDLCFVDLESDICRKTRSSGGIFLGLLVCHRVHISDNLLVSHGSQTCTLPFLCG